MQIKSTARDGHTPIRMATRIKTDFPSTGKDVALGNHFENVLQLPEGQTSTLGCSHSTPTCLPQRRQSAETQSSLKLYSQKLNTRNNSDVQGQVKGQTAMPKQRKPRLAVRRSELRTHVTPSEKPGARPSWFRWSNRNLEKKTSRREREPASVRLRTDEAEGPRAGLVGAQGDFQAFTACQFNSIKRFKRQSKRDLGGSVG